MSVDAHTHLDTAAFATDRDAVVDRAIAAGVHGVVIAAADPDDWDALVASAAALTRRLRVAWTLGVHPWWLADLDDARADALVAALRDRPTPHGIGETGLDHARATDDAQRALQRRVFRDHLALARERDVPVVLHVVRAYPEALRVMEADGLPAAGGMVHAWSGHPDLVRRALRLGLRLSFGGPLGRSERLARAIVQVPDDALLLETDCPDQPVTPGTRGEPADLLAVATTAAALRAQPVDAVLAASAATATRLFPVLARAPLAPAGPAATTPG
ncbi:MAG: TatD family hydrolase [Alphaproteobacteria bacterium]|nr:TatD family hydrolase [Alphaproteobacteria bacterium]